MVAGNGMGLWPARRAAFPCGVRAGVVFCGTGLALVLSMVPGCEISSEEAVIDGSDSFGENGGSAEATGNGEVYPSECTDPRELPQRFDPDRAPSGIEHCYNGALRRVARRECYVDWDVHTGEECAGVLGECGEDSDCTDGPNGACVNAEHEGVCACRYACTVDEDCAPGEACLCSYDPPDREDNKSVPTPNGYTACVPAMCTTNEDCGAEDCLVSGSGCGGVATGLFCSTPDDSCHGTYECDIDFQCSRAGGPFACASFDGECGGE